MPTMPTLRVLLASHPTAAELLAEADALHATCDELDHAARTLDTEIFDLDRRSHEQESAGNLSEASALRSERARATDAHYQKFHEAIRYGNETRLVEAVARWGLSLTGKEKFHEAIRYGNETRLVEAVARWGLSLTGKGENDGQ